MVTRTNGMNPVNVFNGATSFTTGLYDTKVGGVGVHKQSNSQIHPVLDPTDDVYINMVTKINLQ
jgi:hypothetical protein